MKTVIVIGAGISGLVSAIALAKQGKQVTLISKGIGGIQLSQGTVDIYGYGPQRVAEPLKALANIPPAHPY
ncbi:MAG: FAD-dependent oxidoreductase, partial [Propionibacteriaceae bacterium]|nr:FAD-dependent oxidoreductase [Propionibacteriaceae bacterium]